MQRHPLTFSDAVDTFDRRVNAPEKVSMLPARCFPRGGKMPSWQGALGEVLPWAM
ncbi:MAG: hypothetical protein MI919_32940 [Holophagales bacterium]|nr:hypothetical protein [Holophagales bacterium]